MDEHISGNKFRKLIYNLQQASLEGYQQLVSFGGAFSNHLVALAAAGNRMGFRTVGVVRGRMTDDELAQNPSLQYCLRQGMQLDFVSRAEYARKETSSFLHELKKKWGDFYLIPEGGTNELAIKGCREILNKNDDVFETICLAVGTGGTLAGVALASGLHQTTLGFSALRHAGQSEKIRTFVEHNRWKLIEEDVFGGYAKIKPELVHFCNEFYKLNQFQLDPIYTGKMLFRMKLELEKNKSVFGNRILVIHTGGLQGIEGMNQKLKNKGWPQFDY